MLKSKLFLFSLLLSGFGFSQTIEEGDSQYERFEYDEAGLIFEKLASSGTLDQIHQEKLAYCYFVTNQADKGLSYTENLMKSNASIELLRYKAFHQRELGQYQEAFSTANEYINKGGQLLPLKFRESCSILLNTPERIEGSVETISFNDRKANGLNYTGKNAIYYSEFALDSNYRDLGLAASAGLKAEAFLMRPIVNDQEWEIIDDSIKDLSINGLQFIPSLGKVFFSASFPASGDKLYTGSHIYWADAARVGEKINTINNWEFGGFSDSSSCAHVTMTTNGEMMVFSKMADQREDADLYFSKFSGGVWSNPSPIPGLNTRSDEMFPQIAGDSVLYFSSEGHIGYGGLDVFYIPITNDWSYDTILRLPLPLNSTSDDFNYQKLSDTSSIFVSNRSKGKGDDDVWLYLAPPRPIPPVIEPIAEVKGLNIDSLLDYWNKQKVYFEFNKGLTPEQFAFVEQLKDLYNQGYVFDILVTGYADSRGSSQANQLVGMKRAQAVKANMVKRGINTAYMTCKSEGSSKIENRCKTQYIKCTEEEHKENRFVRLTITQKK
ncbi:MAG: OmpA family protein [Bacteroidota bacterium]